MSEATAFEATVLKELPSEPCLAPVKGCIEPPVATEADVPNVCATAFPNKAEFPLIPSAYVRLSAVSSKNTKKMLLTCSVHARRYRPPMQLPRGFIAPAPPCMRL